MKALIQRVSCASVEVDGACVGRIDAGLLVLLGIRREDARADADRLCRRLPNLRLFTDADGLMNRSVRDIQGGILVVSQFTLYADTRKGNRPGFSDAAPPEIAEPLYRHVLHALRADLGAARVAAGVFGAHMQVSLCNDGPVTIELVTEGSVARQ